jgi:hypothetical protein
MGDLIVRAVSLPGIMFSAGETSAQRFMEFFTVQIRNPNTRRPYAKASTEFFGWCEIRGVRSLDSITPVLVTGWTEEMTGTRSAPTVKQRLGLQSQADGCEKSYSGDMTVQTTTRLCPKRRHLARILPRNS